MKKDSLNHFVAPNLAKNDTFPYNSTPDENKQSNVIYCEKYCGYPIFIKSIGGMFPSCYVDVLQNDLTVYAQPEQFNKQNLDFDITYADDYLMLNYDRMYDGAIVGWHYAHQNQFCAAIPEYDGKKYTIAEILEDAHRFVDDILVKNNIKTVLSVRKRNFE